MLRSLAVLLGCAFFLRFVALESLYAPGRGVIKRLMTALMEGITLGALDYAPAGQRTGYVAFLTLSLYLIGLALLPVGGHRAVSGALVASGIHPSPTSWTETCPRFGVSETRSTAPAASNSSVILRVSCATSSLSARARSAIASRFSVARRMSSALLHAPADAARGCRRASERTDAYGLAAENRPENRRAHRQAGLELLLGGLRGLALDGCRGATLLFLDLRLLGRELLPHRIHGRVPGDALSVAHANLKVTLALTGIRGQLQDRAGA